MVEMIEQGTHVARKIHGDSSWEYLWEWLDNCRPFHKAGPTFSEYRAIVNFVANKGKILPGQKYHWQRNKQDGFIFTWKSLPDIEAICKKYDVYPYSEWR